MTPSNATAPLPRRAEPRWHPAVRHDDRHADAASVPDGLLGASRPAAARATRSTGGRARPVLPRRRAGHASPRFQRHGVLGRTAARAPGRSGSIAPARVDRDHPRHRPASTSTRSCSAAARRCWRGRRAFRKSRSGPFAPPALIRRQLTDDAWRSPRIIASVLPVRAGRCARSAGSELNQRTERDT